MKRTAIIAGWILVWGLFVLFNVLLLTGRIVALLYLTLGSLLPIWILSAVGGSLEVATLLRARPTDKKGEKPS
ncbi:MAG: hypothetical protein Q9Q40_15425 [Acidobacteriota bacterium]|nr:hypothetical protein [Acidobacteriota bacterium]MDQ7088386.1 hypothetical protein [Acidobacteriota bacterium]